MLKFLADECCHNPLLEGIVRYCPEIDLVRCIDVGLQQQEDIEVARWAINQDRVLITHDRRTMIEAWSAAAGGLDSVPSLVVIHDNYSHRSVIDDICLMAWSGTERELWNRVIQLW